MIGIRGCGYRQMDSTQGALHEDNEWIWVLDTGVGLL